jgi:hypothetical protein
MTRARSGRAFASACALALIASALVVWVGHAGSYFFLFDDYALVGQSLSNSLGAIFRTPLVGFYRPSAFVLLKAESLLWGWSRPWAFATAGIGLHLANSLLVWRLFRLVSPRHGLFTALLFLISPWAGEAVFWMSGRFDLFATTMVLGTLIAGDRFHRSRTYADATCWAVLGGGSAAAALLAKESTIVLPGLWILQRAFQSGIRPALDKRSLQVLAFLWAAALAYLLLRQQYLPAWTGAYGNYRELFNPATVVSNYVSFWRTIVWLPLPARVEIASMTAQWGLAWPCMVVVLPVLVASGLRSMPRGGFAVLAFSVALMPVIWIGGGGPSTAGGRMLYLPGVWAAAVIALGLVHVANVCERTSSTLVCRSTCAFAVVLLVAYFAASLRYQGALWSRATFAARNAMMQFEQRLPNLPAAIGITNLPFRCDEGPLVLKSYAFGYFFAPRHVPRVHSRGLVLSCEEGVTPAVLGEVDDADGPPHGSPAVPFSFDPPVPAASPRTPQGAR